MQPEAISATVQPDVCVRLVSTRFAPKSLAMMAASPYVLFMCSASAIIVVVLPAPRKPLTTMKRIFSIVSFYPNQQLQ